MIEFSESVRNSGVRLKARQDRGGRFGGRVAFRRVTFGGDHVNRRSMAGDSAIVNIKRPHRERDQLGRAEGR